MAEPKHPLRDLADGGEGFGKEVVERFAIGEPLLEAGGLGGELRIAHRRHLGLERVDLGDASLIDLEGALVGGSEEGAGETGKHRSSTGVRVKRSPPSLPVARGGQAFR